MFSWIPIHRETIEKIVKQPVSQNDLLQVLRDMEQQGLNVISLQDKDTQGQAMPMAEIDPFTFLASFNRGVSPEKRRENWAFLKRRWDLHSSVPEDFAGIPVLNNMRSWLFPYAATREKDHVQSLWKVSSQAAEGGIERVDEDLFDRCLQLDYVGISILTICMFWVNPKQFLPADKKTVAYLKAKGIVGKPMDYGSYRHWLQEATERLGQDYAQISHDAHLFSERGQSKLILTPAHMQRLWERFQQAIKGFTDFQNPGTDFVAKETAYKRAVLKRFHEELGLERLTELADQGKGILAVKEIGRVLTSNIVSFHAWNATLGETDPVVCDALREYLKVAGEPYQGPQTTAGLFAVSERHDLRPGWDAVTTLLWALRPDDYFPVKISYYRKLSEELGHELPSGRPDAEKLDNLITWGRSFWHALEPHKPADWVDVQSFIWCVCPDTYQRKTAVEPTLREGMASPFDRVFLSHEEAWWAFDLLRSTLLALGVSVEAYGDDRRISLTLPAYRGRNLLRLNFGNWLILGFAGEEPHGNRLSLALRKDLLATLPGAEYSEFSDSIDGQPFVVADVPISRMQAEEGPERIAFQTSLRQIAKRFSHWKATVFQRSHRPELAQMVFDETIRKRLLSEGLPGLPDGDGGLPEEVHVPRPAKAGPYDRKQAMHGLFMDETQLDEMLTALREKKNVILQGAPGVGKTYVAKRLAYLLMGEQDPTRVEMIQFHQSYSYEDFIQGFRPTPGGHFDLKYGIFHQFCVRAQGQEAEGNPYVFIIDEINRGNLSKIFGELMMLVEPDKRGREHAIALAYSQITDPRFYIPENVYLIGTLNTADRSLAMVDYALRRRFRFITLRPEFESAAFRAFLVDAGAQPKLVDRIVRRMTALNEIIAADVKGLGPGYQIGHSYFCPRGGVSPDQEWYRRVIESEIIPLIQEYWFDNEQRVQEQKAALLD